MDEIHEGLRFFASERTWYVFKRAAPPATWLIHSDGAGDYVQWLMVKEQWILDMLKKYSANQ